MQQILVLAADESPRLRYILNEILKSRLGLDFKITDSEDYFVKAGSPRINYGNNIIEGCLNIPSVNLLYQDNIIKQEPNFIKDDQFNFTGYQAPYQNIPDPYLTTYWWHFDVFSAAFFLLSRYEEYLPNKTDGHGRFSFNESLAWKAGFLEIPLVDIWTRHLETTLNKLYPQLVFKKHVYKQINSVDIDRVFKYKGCSAFELTKKKISHFVKRQPEALHQLNQFIQNKINDPYDTFDTTSKHDETVYFWLLSNNKHKYDKNVSISNPIYQEVIKGNKHIIHGIHPSYYASANSKQLQAEINNFKQLFGTQPLISRQHFLKLQIPKTYHELLAAGIKEDWSLLYAGHCGFRASTCFAFNFFDLRQNQATELLVQPIALMDVTLKNNMKLNLIEATQKIIQLKNQVKSLNGKFISIWHNSSFDPTEGWGGWGEVYQTLLQE